MKTTRQCKKDGWTKRGQVLVSTHTGKPPVIRHAGSRQLLNPVNVGCRSALVRGGRPIPPRHGAETILRQQPTVDRTPSSQSAYLSDHLTTTHTHTHFSPNKQTSTQCNVRL